MLNFFICINSLKTRRPCGVKLSLPRSFLDRASRKRARQIERARGGKGERGGGRRFLGVWVGDFRGREGEKKGVVDHGKNTIPGPSIALVPPHFTRTPTLCVPLATDPCNPLLILPEPLSPSLSLSLSLPADVCQPPTPFPTTTPPSSRRPVDPPHSRAPLPVPLTPRDGEAWWGRGCAWTP